MMKVLQKSLLLLVCALGIGASTLTAQNHEYYARAINAELELPLFHNGTSLKYFGQDLQIREIFNRYDIYVFEPAFPNSRRSMLQRTFKVEANSPDLIEALTQHLSQYFEFAEYLGVKQDVLAANPPDDYGQTGGANNGLNARHSNLDFIGAPEAWEITSGDMSIKIGISDGKIETSHPDLEKTDPLSGAVNNNPQHGTGVSAIAAAQGDNGQGITGVCYNCDILSSGYDYDKILELSYAGAKVINCSWGSYAATPNVSDQMCIDEAYDNGSIIVAASHNANWNDTQQGNRLYYPASFNHVISTGSVGNRFDTALDSVYNTVIGWKARNVKYHVANKLRFGFTDPRTLSNPTYSSELESTNVLNEAVDILAPGAEIFSFGGLIVNGEWGYNLMHTSPATPHVSGTLGLMLSLNSCLSFEEAESILKITSTNIDHIEANQFAVGKYGSGSLHAGRAVKLTDALKSPDQIAYLENQDFYRWDFVFQGISEDIVIRNQTFTVNSTLNVVSKNSISILPGTLIEPDRESFANLIIDPNLQLDTNCEMSQSENPHSRKKQSKETLNFNVYPTYVDSKMNVENAISDEALIDTIIIFDLFNKEHYHKNGFNSSKIVLELSRLPEGIYIIKGYGKNGVEVINSKFIKK